MVVERNQEMDKAFKQEMDVLVEDILKNCQNSTKLCIACDITLETEYIKTLSVSQWRKTTLPELGKRPTIFLLYK